MAETELRSSESRGNAEERFADLQARHRGVLAALQSVLERVNCAHADIEDTVSSLDDGRAALEVAGLAVSRGLDWIQACVDGDDEGAPKEILAIDLILTSVAERFRRVFSPSRTVDLSSLGDDTAVEGILFQLQDAFLRLLEFADGSFVSAGEVLSVSLSVSAFGERFLCDVGSAIVPGDYVMVRIGLPEAMACDAPCRPFWSAFLGASIPTASDESAVFQVYGVIAAHGGEMFLLGGDQPAGIAAALPMLRKRGDMEAPHNAVDESLRGGETILLVDDEDMIWDVIIDMLMELGYSVVLAGNGKEAVDVYRANPGEIDLVILDMVMPELNGHDAFFQIRELDPDALVLLSSGYVSEDDARDVLDAGAAGFLRKPYRMVDLARKVRELFDASAER